MKKSNKIKLQYYTEHKYQMNAVTPVAHCLNMSNHRPFSTSENALSLTMLICMQSALVHDCSLFDG